MWAERLGDRSTPINFLLTIFVYTNLEKEKEQRRDHHKLLIYTKSKAVDVHYVNNSSTVVVTNGLGYNVSRFEAQEPNTTYLRGQFA